MDSISSVYAGFSVMMIMMLGVLFVVYFALLLVGGVMLYYFTGSKPGKHIVHNIMNVAARLYTNVWMLSTSFLATIGVGLLFKVIIGALFSGFVYSESLTRIARGVNPQQYDLQLGLVLSIVSLIIFAIHFGLNWLVESKAQRRGTLLSKSFMGVGLFISGLWFFGAMITFVMELITYAARATSYSVVYPGATLAFMIASGALWFYYVTRTVMMIRAER